MENKNQSCLGIMVDLAGCPNRCRHCWLGEHRNGCMGAQEFIKIAIQFKRACEAVENGCRELSFFSWWREPDFHRDYRELWRLEQELSSPGRAQRFELLSTWRLARDERYAPWAAALPTQACQVTFFGMEQSTDWGMRRRGAFRDQLTATERCLDAGIAPRWQLFLTKRCLAELDDFLRLMDRLRLPQRCEAIGRRFEFFIGGMTPEGSGYEREPLRIERQDLKCVPRELVDRSRDGLRLLGRPEQEWMAELSQEEAPPGMRAALPCLAVDADGDVYPNLAEPAPWWRLGNLYTDGAEKILQVYQAGVTPGMRANATVPRSTLARRYGDARSSKLYDKDDLICRFMHQWGAHEMAEKT